MCKQNSQQHEELESKWKPKSKRNFCSAHFDLKIHKFEALYCANLWYKLLNETLGLSQLSALSISLFLIQTVKRFRNKSATST